MQLIGKVSGMRFETRLRDEWRSISEHGSIHSAAQKHMRYSFLFFRQHMECGSP